MKDNVVDLALSNRRITPPPVTDFWFAQVETRLGRIERIIKRLEWQIWMIVCGLSAMLFMDVLRILSDKI